MQHKGIMLIVFLEYFISDHGEAGKQNKSILTFMKQFILSLARGKGREIRSDCLEKKKKYVNVFILGWIFISNLG